MVHITHSQIIALQVLCILHTHSHQHARCQNTSHVLIMLRMVRYPTTTRLNIWLSTRNTQVRTKTCRSTSSSSELGGAGKDANRLSSTWTDPISFDLELTLLLPTSSQGRFSTLLHPMFDQVSRQTKSTRSCTTRRSRGMHIRHLWIIGTFQNPSARSFLSFIFFWYSIGFIPRSDQLTKLSATASLIRGSCGTVTSSISVRQYCLGCVARSHIREDVTLYYEGRPGPRPSATIIWRV